MNPKEILRADLLDIIFDNRNKMYGAYALRKNYDKRLFKALIFGVAVAAGICLLVHFSHAGSDTCIIEDMNPKHEVTLVEIPKDDPVIPEARAVSRPQAGSRLYTNNIAIVPDDVAPTDIPTTGQLEHAMIGDVTRDGVEPSPNTTVIPATQPEENQVHPGPAPTGLIQKQPEFPGGIAAWRRFLERHLRAPDELGFGERKTVQVKFLVSEDGSVTSFNVVQSGGEAFDNEVIRVLKKMPKWSPAVQNGRNVAVTFTQPVTFQSVEE